MATILGLFSLGVVSIAGSALCIYCGSRRNVNKKHESEATALTSNLRKNLNMNEEDEVQQDVNHEEEESGKQSTDDNKEFHKQDVTSDSEQDHKDPKQEMEFDTNPTFVKTIRTKAAKKDSKAIFGLTVLHQELFIISEHSPDVEVYDSMSLAFKHQFNLEGLYDPVDIKSCSKNNCLYIFDWKDQTNELLRIGSDGKLITTWKTGGDGGYISITKEGNVMLSVWDKRLLKEFTADGQLIREIQLPATITELRLAIKLSSGNFVVSHGEDEESEHRVCLVDDKGVLIKSIGGKQGLSKGEFNRPNYMVVDGTGFILVADQNNKRVVLLSPDLEFKQELIQEKDGLRYPVRMYLDQASGRLFVADNDYLEDHTGWRDGRVMAFDFKIRQTS